MVTYFFAAFAFIDYLVVIFSFGLSKVFSHILMGSSFNLLQSIESGWIQSIIYLFFIDFAVYWLHRLSHSNAALWELHKFHHSATEMSIMTTSRIHPLETAIYNMMMTFPLFFIGVPLETYAIFLFSSKWLGHLHHANVPWDWGFIGKYIIISPKAHQLHHSTQERHFNTNLGHLTPMWDRLFGTWYDKNEAITEIGLENNQYNRHGILNDYLMPVKRFATAIVKGIFGK